MPWLPRRWPKRIALLLLAVFFVYAGVSHFTNPGQFDAIVPPWLPAALALVYVSGVFEILGGLGALCPGRAPSRAGAGGAARRRVPGEPHMALDVAALARRGNRLPGRSTSGFRSSSC